MSSLSLGWPISKVKPAIDRCRSLCSNDVNAASLFADLAQQLEELDSVSDDPEDPPTIDKIYLNLEVISQTLEQCQVFLNRNRAIPLRHWTVADRERNADLIKRLKFDTQTLEVYYGLLRRWANAARQIPHALQNC
jgi:hypothetical protein